MKNASSQFWQGKQVLLTGHTGFKGAWLAIWLSKMGAKVTGISLTPNSTPNLFTLANIAQITNSNFADIRHADEVSSIVKKVEPEIILHLAAQALVRPSFKDPLTTFQTNVIGTANILNSSRDLDSVKAIVVVTTDKVYKNLEIGRAFKEDDQLGGFDPYSASKAASEIIISSYRDSYLAEQGVAVASVRAGNVIGGGDWSDDRLIPDAVRAWDSDLPLKVRRPNAIRPWQHVLEPLNGYLVLAEKLCTDLSFSGAYNFGPKTDEAATVKTVIELANQAYGHGSVLWSNGAEGPHEASLLSLEISKVQEILGINPRWNLTETIKRTMGWYQDQRNGVNAHLLCDADIEAFSSS
jgi:CDP-glucose 4,6-dehydratase